MHTFLFTSFAKKRFLKLDKNTQDRIKQKLKKLREHNHIESILKPLTDMKPATHRLRIGNYRLILKYEGKKEILVLDAWHRDSVYK